MDKRCNNCLEPWDTGHVLDTLGFPANNIVPDDGSMSDVPVTDLEGSVWKFWVMNGGFLDCSYQILQCPSCVPYLGKDWCGECHGYGRIFVWTAERFPGWNHGLGNYIEQVAVQPYRMLPSQKHLDGVSRHGIARCPSCFRKDSDLFIAAALVGWNEYDYCIVDSKKEKETYLQPIKQDVWVAEIKALLETVSEWVCTCSSRRNPDPRQHHINCQMRDFTFLDREIMEEMYNELDK